MVEVLNAVRLGGATSRQEVANLTGLGRAAVTQRVSDLVGVGLITEAGVGPSTGGRPPRQLSFRADAGHLLVGFLGATSLDVALVTAGNEILARCSEPIDIASGPDVVLDRLEMLFDAVRDQAGRSPGPLWGIGIAVPGPVEFSSGRPIAPPIMPGWDRYPLRERLTHRFRVPVWVDNDVNAMAIGESRHGVAQGHRNVVFLKIGTGIGAGLISDGRLLRGAQGSAGDVGHIRVTDDPSIVCRCGNQGCLEAIAGGGALARDGERATREGRSAWLTHVLADSGAVTARDLADGASHGDVASIELLRACGRHVGQMLAGIVNLLNPSLIVIGGGVAEAGDLLLASLRQVIYGRSLPLATRSLVISRSTLGDLAGQLGLAAMVLDELFSPELLPIWIGEGRPAVLAMELADHG